jgi:hypothetical protein
LITVLVGLVIVAYLIRLNSQMDVVDILSWKNLAKDRQSEAAGKLSEAKTVPQEVLRHRQAHQLRPLTELEEGAKIQDLPNGIYGYSSCKVESLSAKRGNTFSLEIHKHDDGILYYVGYASEEQIEKYLTQKNNFHILTSPHPKEQASSLFEIPVAFVSKCEERAVGNSYLLDLFVTAIPISPT